MTENTEKNEVEENESEDGVEKNDDEDSEVKAGDENGGEKKDKNQNKLYHLNLIYVHYLFHFYPNYQTLP